MLRSRGRQALWLLGPTGGWARLLDIEVIIEADSADAPLGKHVSPHRKRLYADRSNASSNWRQVCPSRGLASHRSPEPRGTDHRVQFLQVVETLVVQTAFWNLWRYVPISTADAEGERQCVKKLRKQVKVLVDHPDRRLAGVLRRAGTLQKR